jgi:ketosteroid isomerase-like protein
MSKKGFAVLLLTVWLAACATTNPASTEQQIRALEQEQVHAVIARDRAVIERLFAPDFMIINPSGAVADKQALLDLLVGGEAPYRSGTYQTETVRVYGDTVVTTGLEKVVPARGATAGQTVQRRITHVWERHTGAGAQWQLVLRHATVVTSPP